MVLFILATVAVHFFLGVDRCIANVASCSLVIAKVLLEVFQWLVKVILHGRERSDDGWWTETVRDQREVR